MYVEFCVVLLFYYNIWYTNLF